MTHHGRHGIVLDNCYEDPRVNDSLMTYNKQSGLEILGCHDIVVSGNHFEENLDAVRLQPGGVHVDLSVGGLEELDHGPLRERIAAAICARFSSAARLGPA